jgi:NAD(P)-dependent dehydrogenase (short-subunit alcohol dehydrogenase family)
MFHASDDVLGCAGVSGDRILDGRVVLVTGAGQGVGAAIATYFGSVGARVAVTARKPDAADAVARTIVERGGTAIAVRCDVTVRRDIDDAIGNVLERFGVLQGLVHNAISSWSSKPIPFEDVTDENWDDQVAVALRGAHWLAQAGFAALRESGGAYLILSSSAGMEGSTPVPAYSTVKGAQRAFIKALAREWGPAGVRVNGLAPIAVTPAMADFFARTPTASERLAKRAALERLGDGETDIGPPAAFLLSEHSRFVTGQTLVVNGGSFMF